MRKIYLAVLMLLICTISWSQSAKIKKADRYMELLDYRAAIPLYQEVLAKNDIPEIKAKIAGAYRKLRDYANAEQWYAQLANLAEPNPAYLYYYGQMLQRNGKCTEAEEWYKRFLRLRPYDPRKKNLQRACAYEEELKKNAIGFSVEILGFNGSGSDLAPAFYKNGLVFGAIRRDSANLNQKNNFDLYFVPIQVQGSTLIYENPSRFSSHLNSKYGEGIATFNNDFTEIYFTRNRQNANPEEPARLEIMRAQNPNDSIWEDLVPLPFNNAAYSVAHPALTPDGERLFFSSDMPGGFGGKDLYYSDKVNGQWGLPVNLGPAINSEGDELYPFYQDKRLYFASDGQIGLGGLDIFYANDLENGDWGEVTNLGAPINSVWDDFGIIVVPQGNFGYFTSNRPGGAGFDDIYSFSKKTNKIAFELTDASTGNQLQAVSIKSDCEENIGVQWTENQPFVVLVEGQCCDFIFNQPGFKEVIRKVCAADSGSSPLKIALQPNVQISQITGTVYDQNSGAPIPDAKIILTSELCKDKLTATTDAQGKYLIGLKKSCCYKLRVEKTDFFATSLEDGLCTDKGSLKKDVFLQPFSVNSAASLASENTSPATVKKEVATFKRSAKDYEGSSSIAYLLNIYYDLGKTTIRADAAEELTKLLKILKDNPDLVVEISAHTDAQGDSRRNLPLSQKRAEAVVSWLIQRGVKRDRLVARGYGETQLVNNCDDGVPCSEAEHQLNRRTEFRVLGKIK